ncbi:hypothetical protein [uncultured Methanolobus sp.]|uniref:hypothetical protein n=1 Tax=uncultured Methanolobus sp. TaxID=218300 RepID=UPI002AAB41E2|nr:hypothetical protein [uncultured Methanolobus sp.]
MKLRKTSKEEDFGTIVGVFAYFAYSSIFVRYLAKTSPLLFNQQTGYSQIGEWVIYGPVILFIMVFPYLMSKKVISEERKIDYLIHIQSSITAFFVWLIVTTSAYLLNIEIGYYANILGGYSTIILLMYYMEKVYSRQIKVICRGYDV